MALTHTATELATAVLRKMTIIDAEETAPTEDSDFVVDAYHAKYYQMADQKLAYWSIDAIPREIFSAVRDLIVNEVKEAYGEPMTAIEKEKEEIILLRPIRRHITRQATGHEAQADYF